MRKKNVNKSFRAICFALLLALVLTACGNKAQEYQDKYDLGAKYVSDGNYEEAIIAYTAAIKIDVKIRQLTSHAAKRMFCQEKQPTVWKLRLRTSIAQLN